MVPRRRPLIVTWWLVDIVVKTGVDQFRLVSSTWLSEARLVAHRNVALVAEAKALCVVIASAATGAGVGVLTGLGVGVAVGAGVAAPPYCNAFKALSRRALSNPVQASPVVTKA